MAVGTSTTALVVTEQVSLVRDPSAVVGVPGGLGSVLWGLAVLPGTNEILVTDFKKHRVVALTYTFDWTALVNACAWGSLGNQHGQLSHPIGVAVTAAGAAWVAESNNHRLSLMH